MRQAFYILLLSVSAFAQLPDSPSHMRSTKSILKDWKFLAGTGVLVASTAFDEKATLDGLNRGVCVENSFENPRPSFGDLAKKDWPVVAGLTAFKFFLAKVNLPWWSYESIDVVGSYKHIHGGVRWITHC